MSRDDATSVQFDEFGLSAFSFDVRRHDGAASPGESGPPHTHLELEMLLIESGGMTLEVGGALEHIRPGELAAYWGGLPHQVVDVDPSTVYHVAQVPIAKVLSWIGSAAMFDRLLSGTLLRSDSSTDQAVSDDLAFERWSVDLATGDPALAVAVELEIQARLHRLIRSLATTDPTGQARSVASAGSSFVAAAIRFVVRHFMESFTVDDIARAAGRNRDHLMATFRAVCGLTLWDYVTRVRLGEAQRLLTTTDLPVLAVCHRSGFSSTSRMYVAFGRYAGQTPAEYRRSRTTW